MVKQSIQKSCAGQILLFVVNYVQNCPSLLREATLARGLAVLGCLANSGWLEGTMCKGLLGEQWDVSRGMEEGVWVTCTHFLTGSGPQRMPDRMDQKIEKDTGLEEKLVGQGEH